MSIYMTEMVAGLGIALGLGSTPLQTSTQSPRPPVPCVDQLLDSMDWSYEYSLIAGANYDLGVLDIVDSVTSQPLSGVTVEFFYRKSSTYAWTFVGGTTSDSQGDAYFNGDFTSATFDLKIETSLTGYETSAIITTVN